RWSFGWSTYRRKRLPVFVRNGFVGWVNPSHLIRDTEHWITAPDDTPRRFITLGVIFRLEFINIGWVDHHFAIRTGNQWRTSRSPLLISDIRGDLLRLQVNALLFLCPCLGLLSGVLLGFIGVTQRLQALQAALPDRHACKVRWTCEDAKPSRHQGVAYLVGEVRKTGGLVIRRLANRRGYG